MIDLRDYYLNNIKDSDYHHRFYALVRNVNKTYNVFYGEQESESYQFLVHDEEEAIDKFRDLCQPGNDCPNAEDTCWFYLIAYYLDACGYIIDEFPNVLRRPPCDPSDFIYTEIRDRIIALGRDDNGVVRYATRRAIVAGMKFKREKPSALVDEDINQKIRLISARNAGFEEMSDDERLREIVNLIENLLKKDGKFIQPDYDEVMFDFVDEDVVKRLKSKLQCFRHSSEEALSERAAFSDEQKSFLIDFGVTICKALHRLVK
ncbi:hypothetical protein [Adlercreutzia sp. ZJ242]|uniref:hypothetical protein n=1 Tax=Adlercreutzia sp. ZJ242 TaxID=2709409 RepID=UPI00197F63E3|nr:hypothetical protein [Adlercreutzia sp. ZJ242]